MGVPLQQTGGGTVTSVTFTGDGVTLSPTPSTAVTTSGTLTATAATQSGNKVIASPANGTSGLLTARTLVSADLPTPSGAATTGLGYFFGGVGPYVPSVTGTAGAILSGTVNKVNGALFYVPFTTSITKVTIRVAAVSASASQFASFGLYDANLNLAVDSTTFNVSSGQATGVRSNTITAAPVNPGFYYFAWTTNSTDATFSQIVAVAIPMAIMNANGNRLAVGQTTTNGVLTSTTGSLSASAAILPYVLFEP